MKMKRRRRTAKRGELILMLLIVALIGIYFKFAAVAIDSIEGQYQQVQQKHKAIPGVQEFQGQRIRPPIKIRNDMIKLKREDLKDVSKIWNNILKEGEQLMKEERERPAKMVNASEPAAKPLVAIEIGANDLRDARDAAEKGLQIHTFEPSPASFEVMMRWWRNSNAEVRDNIFMYNYAVSDTHGDKVFFSNTSSTGATVLTEDEAKKDPEHAVKVETMSMDCFFDRKTDTPPTIPKGDAKDQLHLDFDDKIYVAKVDVQGFEPRVFQGMSKSIQQRKFHYILTEFDPQGIDEMNGYGYQERCEKSVDYLYQMHDAGYELFALTLVTHMSNPQVNLLGENKSRLGRPLDDLKKDCLHLYELRNELRNESGESKEYTYWTDYLAVSPDAPLPNKPVTSHFARKIQSLKSEVRSQKLQHKTQTQ